MDGNSDTFLRTKMKMNGKETKQESLIRAKAMIEWMTVVFFLEQNTLRPNLLSEHDFSDLFAGSGMDCRQEGQRPHQLPDHEHEFQVPAHTVELGENRIAWIKLKCVYKQYITNHPLDPLSWFEYPIKYAFFSAHHIQCRDPKKIRNFPLVATWSHETNNVLEWKM